TFSRIPKLLTDLPLNTTLYPAKPFCNGNGGSQDDCSVVVGIRSVELEKNFVLVVVRSGEVYRINYNTYNTKLLKQAQKDEQTILTDSSGAYLALVTKNELKGYHLRVLDISKDSQSEEWNFKIPIYSNSTILKMETFISSHDNNFTVLLLVSNPTSVDFLFYTQSYQTQMSVVNIEDPGQLKFSIVRQHGTFNKTDPLRINKSKYDHRTLIALYDYHRVSIVGYGSKRVQNPGHVVI
ncbi:hypothetical protein AKO1_002194, partial [Acrasis kona]